MKLKLKIALLSLFSSTCYRPSFSQTEEPTPPHITDKNVRGFHTGIYIGSLFANKSSASFYDGYGYDTSGIKNTFAKSFMYRRIIIDYGGGAGQTDQVAQALGVSPGDWTFDETDMPINMKYNPAITAGVHLMYSFNKNNSILLNASVSKLTASGNFTIVLNTNPIGAQQPNYQNIQTFSITGSEQRSNFQLGFQRIFGKEDGVNCFLEGGAELTLAKYIRNQATINNLHIDLSAFYSIPYYSTYRARYLSGLGLGAFAGFGMNYFVNAKCRLQLLYDPSYEKINIGTAPKLKLQHSAGLRIYYHL